LDDFDRLSAVLLIVLVWACLGCAARRVSVTGDYHLNGIFLVPPDAPEQPKNAAEMQVSLGDVDGAPRGRPAKDCSIHDRWFSLYSQDSRKTVDWFARVPLPAAWEDSDLVVNNHAEWDRFFDHLGALQSKGCITAEAYWAMTNSLAESMPALVIYALFFRYSFGTEGYVKLKPGMRLFIERSIFRNPSESTDKVSNYWGERKVYYEIAGEQGKGIALRRSGEWRSKGLPRRAGAEFPDTELARQFVGMRALRLFVLTLFVPPNLHRNSLLIGVRDPEEMVRATEEIKKNAEIPCKVLGSQGIACASFEGVVTASVEMNVAVNGHAQHFPIGSTVETAMAGVSKESYSKALATLRIRRLFRGTYRDVKFDAGNPEVPKLPLFARDRISWR
jgi:hypothetical protein